MARLELGNKVPLLITGRLMGEDHGVSTVYDLHDLWSSLECHMVEFILTQYHLQDKLTHHRG